MIRETIIDRRQPVIRWSAIFAGGAVSIGVWLLLQTLGLGIGLATVDRARSVRDIGMGVTVWSLIAPLIAMFIGGVIAARFAMTRARRIGSLHGIVMWALASVVGFATTVWTVTMFALGTSPDGAAMGPEPTPHMTAGALICTGLTLLVSLGGAALGGAVGIRRDDEPVIRAVATTPVVPPLIPPL